MNPRKVVSYLIFGISLLSLTACQAAATPTDLPSSPTQPDIATMAAPPGPARPPETIAIFNPKSMQPISGGELQVSGYSEYFLSLTLAWRCVAPAAVVKYIRFAARRITCWRRDTLPLRHQISVSRDRSMAN